MSGMTPRMRIITYVSAAALVIATTVGCGALSKAKKIAGNAVELGNLSEKMTNAEKLTYKAVYKDSDGGTDEVDQAPPKVAYLSKDSDWIFTGDTIYNCDTESGTLTCSKTANTSTDSADTAALLGGGTFMTGALGITLLAAALLLPSSDVKSTSKTIAGQKSTCVDASGLESSDIGSGATSGTGSDDTDISSFSMCVADNGVVTNFVGTDTKGKKSGITMTSFSTNVDNSKFGPPAGATIVDGSSVPTVSSGPDTSDSTAPSDSAAPSDGTSPAPSAS